MDGATPFPGADLARDWPVLAAALARRDPAAAQALWREGIAFDVPPARPLVATAAVQIALRLPEAQSAAWAAEAGPLAKKAVEEAVARFDPERYGFPVWPQGPEPLFPDAPGGREGTDELGAMLVREAASLRKLGADSSIADDEEMAIRDMFASRLLDGDFLLFSSLDGKTADDTPGGLFPMVMGGLEESALAVARERAGDVFSDGGWSAEGCVVFALLAGEGRLAEEMARHLRPCGKPWEEAWKMLCAGGKRRRKAEKKVAWFGAGVAALVASAAILAGGWERKNAAVGENAARELCREGKHAEAAAAYAVMGGAYGKFREAGEWLHAGKPAKAETLYRELIASGKDGDSVKMNLALAMYRGGKGREAEEAYRAIEEAGGPASQAAKKAADILEDLLALAP